MQQTQATKQLIRRSTGVARWPSVGESWVPLGHKESSSALAREPWETANDCAFACWLSSSGHRRSHESEEKEGGTQTREQWSPFARARFTVNEPRQERDRVNR